jgi:hypothetical protein
MARVSAYVGTFTKRSGTGTQDITGVGFTPKAIVFWTTLRTAQDGFEAAAQRFCFGFSDGTNHTAVSRASENGSLDTAGGHRNDCCLLIVDLDNSVNSVGVVSALGADGFTVNWTTAAGHANVLINFLALGGTNVSAKVGDVATNSGTGTQSITGVGFEPDVVLFLANASSNAATEAGAGFGPMGFGWMTTGGEQGAACTDTATGPGRLRRYQRTDRCVVAKGYGSVEYEGAFSAMGTDGFTVN